MDEQTLNDLRWQLQYMRRTIINCGCVAISRVKSQR